MSVAGRAIEALGSAKALSEPAIASARSARILVLAFMVDLLWVLRLAGRGLADVDGIRGATYVRAPSRSTRFCAFGMRISTLFFCHSRHAVPCWRRSHGCAGYGLGAGLPGSPWPRRSRRASLACCRA